MAEIDIENIIRYSERIKRALANILEKIVDELVPEAAVKKTKLLSEFRHGLEHHPDLRGWVDVPDKYVKVKEK